MTQNTSSNSFDIKLSHGFKAHWQTIYPFGLRALRAIYTPLYGHLTSIESTDHQTIPFREWKQDAPLSNTDLVILSHGLEGSAESSYIQETGQYLFKEGFDVWAWYMRGCSPLDSGPLLYNSGFTNDLKDLIKEAKKRNYNNIYLIGFSVGGNITLKLLGEGVSGIQKAICFSVPLHLEDVAIHLKKSLGGLYMKRFLKSLKSKIQLTEARYPGTSPNFNLLDQCNDFEHFDEYFTAPMHGFQSAHDYYTRSSSLYFLNNIHTPCLVVNACNDPFLTHRCFPNPNEFPSILFEYTLNGGHCGFLGKEHSMVERALQFIRQ